ncbi:MAG TPA: hypothetical protein PLX06_12510 [Fimbriimonadaceae bacterium]|nr:hypothetical protein [Fimbriimonadaceae bacterium]
MTIDTNTSLEELAFIVGTALEQAKQTAVLSGGGAAQIYAPNDYRSRDLDFVLSFFSSDSKSRAVLEELGLKRMGRNMVHPTCPFTVEFPPGPLSVGDDTLTVWDTLKRDALVLNIITPTDSVRDRLAAYLHWNDLGSLESALAVARAQKDRIDLVLIEDWCRREGGEARFEIFRKRLG